MRTFTIHRGGLLSLGIQTKKNRVWVGRIDRRLGDWPLPEGAKVTEGKLLSLPDYLAPEGTALVLIKDQSGREGSWQILSASLFFVVAEGQSYRNDPGPEGGGPEYLGLLFPGGHILFRRTGYLDEVPRDIRVENQPGEEWLRVYSPE